MARFAYDCGCLLVPLAFGCLVTVNYSFELLQQQVIQATLDDLLSMPSIRVLTAIVKALNNTKAI
jgi:hypothetical protein